MATLPDTLAAVRIHGTGCFTGALSGYWATENFSPLGFIPIGVRLTCYGGEASDLPAEVFGRQLDAIVAGRLTPTLARAYHGLEQVRQAHSDLEAGTTPGKHVVVLD